VRWRCPSLLFYSWERSRWDRHPPRVAARWRHCHAVIVGCGLFLWHHPPKTHDIPPRLVIKLDAKLYDAVSANTNLRRTTCFHWNEADDPATRRSVGWTSPGNGRSPGAFNIYPETETNFLCTINGAQLTFIKNDQGEVTAIIHHMAGRPDSEGKKLKKRMIAFGHID